MLGPYCGVEVALTVLKLTETDGQAGRQAGRQTGRQVQKCKKY